MRKLTLALLPSLAIAVIFSCNKKKNDYTSTDNTVGMTSLRSWHGVRNGKMKKDTTVSGTATNTVASYSNIIDTSFAIQKENGFTIMFLGSELRYRVTDSSGGTVKYDTTYAGSAKSELTFYFRTNKIHFEYHKIGDADPLKGDWYQDHATWDTN